VLSIYDRRMQTAGITRTAAADGSTHLTSSRAVFHYRRLRPGVLMVTISGVDDGQFGTMALDEIKVHLLDHRPLELFIDAEAALGVTVEVSKEWTHFFAANRQKLKRVSVLSGTRAIELTIAIAQHLSRTGNLIQIYTDRGLFDERVNAREAS
jgi:hypothetical protein